MLHITTVDGSCIPQYLHAWSGNSLLLYNASSSSSNCNSVRAFVTLETLDVSSNRPKPLTCIKKTNKALKNSRFINVKMIHRLWGQTTNEQPPLTWLEDMRPWSCWEACVWLWDGRVKSVNSNSDPWVSAPIRSDSSGSKNVSVWELGPYASTLILTQCYFQGVIPRKCVKKK